MGGGTIKGTGSFTIADGSYGELVSYWGPSLPTELENKTFKVAPTGTFVMWSDLLLIGTSAIENEGLFDLAEDAVVIKAAPGGGPTFINDGEFRGSGFHTVVEVPFDNNGAVVTKARIDFYDFSQNLHSAELELDGGQVYIAQGSIELGAVLGMNGGTIFVDSTIDGDGLSLLTLKKIDEFSANLVADNASEVRIVDNIWFESARVDLYGLTKWTGGNLDLNDTEIVNHASGVMLIQSNNMIRHNINPVSKFTNHGKIIKSNSGITLFNSIHFQNTGVAPTAGVELLDGTIKFSGGTGEHSGDFVLHEGTIVEFLNTEHDFRNGTNFLGEGVVEARNLTYLRIPIGHDAYIDNLKLLPGNDATVRVGGGVQGNDILPGGTLWVQNALLWEDGIIEGVWFKFGGDGVIRDDPTSMGPDFRTVRFGATLKISGTVDWNSGSINLESLARIVVDGGGAFAGTLNINTDAGLKTSVAMPGLNVSIEGSGILRRNGGAGTASIEVPLHNTASSVLLKGLELTAGYSQWGSAEALLDGATVNVTGGEVAIYGGKFFLGGGTLVAASGVYISGTLSGPGTIQGNVNNDGLVEVGDNGLAGLLTIQGNFTQGISGNTRIELGGLQPGTQYDRLAITGNASLAGKLELALINNFVPAKGDTFAILTYTTRNGKFDTITGTNLGNGLSLIEEYQATQLLLEVD